MTAERYFSAAPVSCEPASAEKQAYFYCYFFIFPDIASLALAAHGQIPKGPGFGLQRRYFCPFFAFNFRSPGLRRGQADEPSRCGQAGRGCSPRGEQPGRLGCGWGWGVPLATAARGSQSPVTAVCPWTSEGHVGRLGCRLVGDAWRLKVVLYVT